MIGMVWGPHVSRYEFQFAPGTKVSKVAALKDDLAYALASTDIRILAPIPGKKAVGVEVPNKKRRLVRLGDIYEGRPKSSSPLVAWLGKDVSGHACWTDIALMPHLLVAGTTGSGKSGCINAILSSILLHASPNECRLVLVDPKRVELNHYENLPHLLTPVVTNPRLAANVLTNLLGEMESRYQVMGEARARNLAELNKTRRRRATRPLPHILCVIDELADLMMVAPAEVEDSIIRLAQKSRAVGIDLVLATQRPSTDVITGTIKVNIPARIAFAVASQVDSRVILDQGGAETLLGQGDMLFRPIGTSKLQRIQGAFLTEDQNARQATRAKQGEPDLRPHASRREGRGPGRGARRRRLLARRGRPPRGCGAHRDRVGDRFRLDDPAAPARRLHARRPPDRHARAPGDHLWLRGFEAQAGPGLHVGASGRSSRAAVPPVPRCSTARTARTRNPSSSRSSRRGLGMGLDRLSAAGHGMTPFALGLDLSLQLGCALRLRAACGIGHRCESYPASPTAASASSRSLKVSRRIIRGPRKVQALK